MATKKAASTAKKSTPKKSSAAKQSTTKVTTVKAVESQPVQQAAVSTKSKRSLRFGLNRTPLVGALVAEFIGTFILAGAVIAGQGQPILVFFALAGVVLAIGTISGGYANPALVLGAWVTRRMSGLRALLYIVADPAVALARPPARRVAGPTHRCGDSAARVSQMMVHPVVIVELHAISR